MCARVSLTLSLTARELRISTDQLPLPPGEGWGEGLLICLVTNRQNTRLIGRYEQVEIAVFGFFGLGLFMQ